MKRRDGGSMWAAPLLLAAGCVAALLIAEWAAATFAVVDTPPGLFRASATRSFEHKPGFRGKDRFGHPIRINSRGLRDQEHAVPKPPKTFRILALGDSVTFGDGVRGEETFSEELERRLSARLSAEGRSAEVLNAGVRGYNTLQQYLLLQETGEEHEPDLVLVGFVLNDAEPIAKQAGLIDPKYGALIRIKNWVRDHSYLYAVLRRSMELFRHRTSTGRHSETYEDQFADDHEGWRACRQALADLKRWSESRKTPLLLVLIPRFESLEREQDYPWKPLHEKVALEAGRLGIDTVDLLPEFIGEDPSKFIIVPTDTFHPNPEGHRRIAAALERTLDQRGFLTAAISAGAVGAAGDEADAK